MGSSSTSEVDDGRYMSAPKKDQMEAPMKKNTDKNNDAEFTLHGVIDWNMVVKSWWNAHCLTPSLITLISQNVTPSAEWTTLLWYIVDTDAIPSLWLMALLSSCSVGQLSRI